MGSFWKQGEPQVWGTAAALSITLLMVATLIGVVMLNGLGFFWPSDTVLVSLKDGTKLLGEITETEKGTKTQGERIQFKVGNRDLYGQDFRWIDKQDIASSSYPDNAVVLERKESGNFYGFLKALNRNGQQLTASATPWEQLLTEWESVTQAEERLDILRTKMSKLNSAAEIHRLKIQKLSFHDRTSNRKEIEGLTDKREKLLTEFNGIMEELNNKTAELNQVTALFEDASGEEKEIALTTIVRAYRPNTMGFFAKAAFYAGKVKELLVGEPRESNTEGGLFPAIFGTVLMVLFMSIFSLPFGVIAAIYLREYAKEGLLVRIVRIAVNNLAGVPSIVYGVFGLGFFIYGLGSGIDQLFYPERLPTPTFGTGGILWASLTLALLTVPVVIVSTEEGLASVPKGLRQGSLSLGATKFQTLIKIVLPMATPGIMTGMILAMARAAGEVAPLMLVGVVKLAPTLPIDGQFPFFHLDRKFMHLGFHIFDVGFQSPNVEAAKPMVFVTTLLLLAIVITASSTAIYLRNKMKKKYATKAF
ncbi:MAG: phosphate ABC transporter permease PstA [Deltaproteobacteria bacterium]|nr:phosphate ABC transporter permease PstA [Deltaproteobacteria bacterium]